MVKRAVLKWILREQAEQWEDDDIKETFNRCVILLRERKQKYEGGSTVGR